METSKKLTVVACSGASNTGQYSDLVARKLMQSGQAKLLCLARFSVDDEFAKKAGSEIEKLIVLDGCPINCAELTVKKSGIKGFTHINTTDFGIVKGKTPVTEEKVKEIVEHILHL
ncbi:MAG: putative zinc-binding protein [Bacteroidota bacterium]|nr:putative zinc-binding protein [Bacteroidota bacterium]